VQVEDHPLDYASFEGVIPKGQYGGGTVMVWDRGAWAPEDENPSAAFRKGKLKFTLFGEKLKGSWALVRMGGAAGEGGKNWLLIKHDDKAAKKPADYDVTQKRAKSVVTKRTLEQIAAAADRVWSSDRDEPAHAKNGAAGKPAKAARKAPARTSAVKKATKKAAAKKAGKKAVKKTPAKKRAAAKRVKKKEGPPARRLAVATRLNWPVRGRRRCEDDSLQRPYPRRRRGGVAAGLQQASRGDRF
jgi:bifunctional non-homologous end joining protein LigD